MTDLTKKQADALVMVMMWGDTHLDDEGRRQYPHKQLFGLYTPDRLIAKGYLINNNGLLLPTPKAEKWWAEYKSSRRRLILKVDKNGKE